MKLNVKDASKVAGILRKLAKKIEDDSMKASLDLEVSGGEQSFVRWECEGERGACLGSISPLRFELKLQASR